MHGPVDIQGWWSAENIGGTHQLFINESNEFVGFFNESGRGSVQVN